MQNYVQSISIIMQNLSIGCTKSPFSSESGIMYHLINRIQLSMHANYRCCDHLASLPGSPVRAVKEKYGEEPGNEASDHPLEPLFIMHPKLP